MFKKFWVTFWINIEEIFEFSANKKATSQLSKIDRYKRYLKHAQNWGEVGGGVNAILDIVKGKTLFYVFPLGSFFLNNKKGINKVKNLNTGNLQVLFFGSDRQLFVCKLQHFSKFEKTV